MLQGKVVDADGHILEPPDLWQHYLENKYKDRAMRLEKDADGVEYLVIDGRPSLNARGLGPAAAGVGQPYAGSMAESSTRPLADRSAGILYQRSPTGGRKGEGMLNRYTHKVHSV